MSRQYLQVAVQHLGGVQRGQALQQLDQRAPDVGLLEVGAALLVLGDLAEEVGAVAELHDDAGEARVPQRGALVLEEGLAVGDDVRVAQRGQDAHLVQRVGFLFVAELQELDALERVVFAVGRAAHPVDGGEGALASVSREYPAWRGWRSP